MTGTRHVAGFVAHHVIFLKKNHVPPWLLGFDRTIQPDKYRFHKIVQMISFNWDCGGIVPLSATPHPAYPLSSWHKELIWDEHSHQLRHTVIAKPPWLYIL